MTSTRLTVLFLIIAGLSSGCMVGPNYQRPQIDIPNSFKEAPTGWKMAEPADAIYRGQWWQIWQDDTLNQLASQVASANLTIAQALANYRQAQAQVQSAQADFFPNLSANTGASRNQNNLGTTKKVSLDASWEIDFWGKTARSVEAATAVAGSEEAALAVAQLSQEAQLVQNYFALRVLDKRKQLAQDTVNLYQRTFKITENQYKVGVVSKLDVMSAQSQLKSAEAQVIDLDLSRKQYEHAIAILIGKAPAQFTLSENKAWQPVSVTIPNALPSSLLERRPDIAQAERNVIAANAKIGVAKAAYYPSLSLSASGGYSATHLADLFDVPSRVWAVGASLAEVLFDGGARTASVKAAQAAYDGSVAGYRLTVLTALQEVEDNLAAVQALAQEQKLHKEALNAASISAKLALNQYKAGTTTFVTVAQAQTSQNNAEQTVWQTIGQELSSQTLLIKALGGGWSQISHSGKSINQ
ncbi:efflux transporter outer membrane subunit [Neisseria sp. Ec49-e6-T10]|uniref:efflux transporter outer membrane subunit n=1 Tax=Neisseria sp. Ec49-e6-T10 TaxID=3140744 RepID=UPI003EBA06CA